MIDAHLTFLPLALPALVAAGRVDVGEGGVLAAAFTAAALGSQPLWGAAGDGGPRARALALAGGAGAGAVLALCALPLPFPALALAAAVAGMGVAACHPAAAALVHALPGPRGRNMAVFLAAGNLGWAVPPLLLPQLTRRFGAAGLGLAGLGGAGAVALLMGLVVWLAWRLEPAPAGVASPGSPVGAGMLGAGRLGRWRWGRVRWGRARDVPAGLILVVALRSAANFGCLAVLPFHLLASGLDGTGAGRLVALFTLAGVAGGLAGGPLSDRVGRRPVTAVSLAAAALAIGATAAGSWPVPAAALWLAAGGAALLASFPVTAVAAQEAMPGSEAAAAGLVLGLAVGLGSAGVAVLGLVAEAWGARAALAAAAGLALAAGAMAALPGVWGAPARQRGGDGDGGTA